MRRLTFIASTFAVAVLTLALAAPADAQHRGGGGGAGPRPGAGAQVRPNPGHGGQVAVPRPNYPHGGYGYPYRPYYGHYPYYGYYRPYYYAPYWGIGFGFSWGWGYGSYGWGYPYYGWGYPYYGWGYPYYGYPYYGAQYYGAPYYDPSGSLRIEVRPRETQVYVDGYLAGVADDFDGTFQRLHVRNGEHHLLLHLNGYKNASQTIYVQPGNTYKITHQMEPLPKGAPQDPIPTPEPGAAAGQNDRPPNDVQARPEPREPYYPPRERESNPPREPSPPQRPPSDQPRSQSNFGAVAIRVQPQDAGIIIDGQAWRGPTDADGAVVIQLSAGPHRVEIARDGFDRYETEIDVRPGTTTPLNVMLQRR